MVNGVNIKKELRIFKILIKRDINLDVVEHCAMIGCGCVFFGIFLSILITGGYEAVEHNIYILSSEIAMGIVLATIGVIQVIRYLRK